MTEPVAIDEERPRVAPVSELLFSVRIDDVERETFTVVCEQCGLELPIGCLHLIDSSTVGAVILLHAKAHP